MQDLERYFVTFAVMLIRTLSFAIFIRAILSWFPIDQSNRIVRFIADVTEPILSLFRRVIPRIGMMDISPLAALLVLNFLADRLAQAF